MPRRCRLVAESSRASLEVTAPFRVSPEIASARMASGAPLWPFAANGWAAGFSRFRLPRNNCLASGLLSWASAPLQRLPKHRAAAARLGCPRPAAPPMRFFPLQRFPARDSGLAWPGPPTRPPCAYRFSRPLGAFIRPEPAGLVSCRIRSWGLPFRALLLTRSRTLLPTPLPLLAFGPPSGSCSARQSATRVSGLG